MIFWEKYYITRKFRATLRELKIVDLIKLKDCAIKGLPFWRRVKIPDSYLQNLLTFTVLEHNIQFEIK